MIWAQKILDNRGILQISNSFNMHIESERYSSKFNDRVTFTSTAYPNGVSVESRTPRVRTSTHVLYVEVYDIVERVPIIVVNMNIY